MPQQHDHLFKSEAVEWRVWAGLILIGVGVATIPLGFWFAGHAVTALGVLVFLIGIVLFASERQVKRTLRVDREANVHPRHPGLIGGDVHNHSGWLSGWRKTGPAVEPSRDGSGAGGDAADGD